MKMRTRSFTLPAPQVCTECKAETRWEISQGSSSLFAEEIEMHYCTCPKSKPVDEAQRDPR